MAKTELLSFSLLLLLLLLLLVPIQSQSQNRSIAEALSDPVSDAIGHVHQHSSSSLSSSSSSSNSSTCHQTYNFIPCTKTILGNIFFVLVYGYFMFHAANYLSTSTELFVQISEPGFGGISLFSFSKFPDAALILVSGLTGSKETAQKKVLVGMGLLCGSTILRLTLVWASCIVAGRWDLSDDPTSIDSRHRKRCSLTGTGVTTDFLTRSAARIMTLSAMPFIIVLPSQAFKTSSGSRITILVSLIVAIALMLSYFIYQYFEPSIQRRRLAYVKHKYIMSGLLRYMASSRYGRLLTGDGQPDKEIIEKLFRKLDKNGDGYVTRQELTSVIIGIQFEDIDFDQGDTVENIMEDFDTSDDTKIDMAEFSRGIIKWLEEAKRSVPKERSKKFVDEFHKKIQREYDTVDMSDEVIESVENRSRVKLKAIWMLCLGTIMASIFASPFVDSITNFSNATNIPSFFISFVAIPLATYSREAVSEITIASKKRKRTISLTLSQIYGAVTNNIIGLAVFLALVYARHLTWDFSTEVLVIFFVCVVMGLFTSFRMTFPLWTCFVAYLLYPLSLVLVYVFVYVIGWSKNF